MLKSVWNCGKLCTYSCPSGCTRNCCNGYCGRVSKHSWSCGCCDPVEQSIQKPSFPLRLMAAQMWSQFILIHVGTLQVCTWRFYSGTNVLIVQKFSNYSAPFLSSAHCWVICCNVTNTRGCYCRCQRRCPMKWKLFWCQFLSTCF